MESTFPTIFGAKDGDVVWLIEDDNLYLFNRIKVVISLLVIYGKQDAPAHPLTGIKIDLKTGPFMRNLDTIQQISIKTDGIKD